MKTLYTVVSCLVAISIHSVTYSDSLIASQSNEIVQAQNVNSNDSLQVSISEKIRVLLKEGSPQSGNLVRLTTQNLILAAGDQQKTLEIAKIKSIEFQGDVWIASYGGTRRKIRGQDRTTRQQRTWANVPLNALDVQQNSKTALLKLGNVLSPNELRDLQSDSLDAIYILDKIEFAPSGQQMTVKATPIDR